MIKVFVKYQEIEKELEFPGGAVVKSPSATVGDTRNAGLIPASRRSPRVGNGTPLQYTCLENSMGRGTGWATVCEATKSHA